MLEFCVVLRLRTLPNSQAADVQEQRSVLQELVSQAKVEWNKCTKEYQVHLCCKCSKSNLLDFRMRADSIGL